MMAIQFTFGGGGAECLDFFALNFYCCSSNGSQNGNRNTAVLSLLPPVVRIGQWP